jgi:hypothetical protein
MTGRDLMAAARIDLSEAESRALKAIAQRTGKTEDELLRDAVTELIARFQSEDRRALLRQARGMWKDRQDLPDPAALRRELDRM